MNPRIVTPAMKRANAERAHEKLLDAAGALTSAHDAHITCDSTSDEYAATLHLYNVAKDKLAACAISYSRALEAAAGILD